MAGLLKSYSACEFYPRSEDVFTKAVDHQAPAFGREWTLDIRSRVTTRAKRLAGIYLGWLAIVGGPCLIALESRFDFASERGIFAVRCAQEILGSR